jgi:hypothetical protein
VSRTNWALLLIGAILTVGGVATTGAIVYDMSTGRASFGDVVRDIAVFIEGWFTALFPGGFYDAELRRRMPTRCSSFCCPACFCSGTT